MDPAELEAAFRERPAIHRFPGSMARRVQDLCAVVADEYDGKAERVWTEASDAADLKKRIGALPGFGAMKITGLGSVLALRFDVEAARDLVPSHPCLGAIDSPEALAEYQAAKRAHKAELRAAQRPRDGPGGRAGRDRDRDADGRRAASRRHRAWCRRASSRRPARSLDLALYDVRFETDAGALVLASLLGAVQRGVDGAPALQPRPPRADPRAAPARDGARGDRGASDRDARHRGHPGSDAPQVRRARRRGGLGRIDELDGRLVVAPGERHRDRRVPRDRVRVFPRIPRALGERDGRAHRERRSPPRGRRRRPRAPVVHSRARRGALAPDREAPGQGANADPHRVARCSRPARSWPLSSRS